jgi:hypothetical protein
MKFHALILPAQRLGTSVSDPGSYTSSGRQARWFLAYGALLIWAGFCKRAELLRWQAIVLIGITIIKHQGFCL